jgi:hypothetical protein
MASLLRAEDKYDAAIDYIRNILALNSADGESWSSLGMYRGHCLYTDLITTQATVI